MLILLNLRSNDETYVKLKTPIFGVVDRVKAAGILESHGIDSEIVGIVFITC